jgi:hypothetical protein
MRVLVALLFFVAVPAWAAPCVIKKPLKLTTKADGSGGSQRLFSGAKAQLMRVVGDAAQVKSGGFVGYVSFDELRAKSSCAELAPVAPKKSERAAKKPASKSHVVAAPPAPIVVAAAKPTPVAAPAPIVAHKPIGIASTLLTANGPRLILFPLDAWPNETAEQASSLLPLLADLLGSRYHTVVIVPEVVGVHVDCRDDACRNEVAGALGAQRFVHGRLSRSPFGSTLSLALVRVPSGNEEAEVDEQFQGHPAGAAVMAVEHLHSGGGAPLAAPTVAQEPAFEVAQSVTRNKWRPVVGWTCAAVGVAAAATGAGVFFYERGAASTLASSVNAFNAQTTRSAATYAQLNSASSTVATGQAVGIAVAAVGVAALGVGLGVLLSGGSEQSPSVSLVPGLGGAAIVGGF